MQVADMVQLSSGLAPSLSQLIGSNANPELLNRMNQQASENAGGIIFGDSADPYAHKYNKFMENIIMPMQEVGAAIHSVVRELDVYRTQYRPITNALGLFNPTNEIKEVILTHPEINKQLTAKKISDWGIKNINKLHHAKEFYDRICYESVIEDITDDEDDGVCETTWYSSDYELSDREEAAIITTRAFVEKFVTDKETKDINITKYPEELETGKLK